METLYLAQEEAAGGGLLPLLMIVLLFAVMYFLLIRPQQKRRREAADMQSKLAVGDEVVTIGGLYGTVAEVPEDGETVILETSEGAYSRYARAAISRISTPADAPDELAAEADTSTTTTDTTADNSAEQVVERRDQKD